MNGAMIEMTNSYFYLLLFQSPGYRVAVVLDLARDFPKDDLESSWLVVCTDLYRHARSFYVYDNFLHRRLSFYM